MSARIAPWSRDEDQGGSLSIALTIMMTGILLLGLLRREKLGFARIGFESTLILILYGSSVAFVLQ